MILQQILTKQNQKMGGGGGYIPCRDVRSSQ